MTKKGLKRKLKALMYSFLTNELWDKWYYLSNKERYSLQRYKKLNIELPQSLDKKARDIVKEWLELDIMYLMRHNGEFLKREEYLINQSRIQAFGSKVQIIEAIEQDDKAKELAAIKKKDRLAKDKERKNKRTNM